VQLQRATEKESVRLARLQKILLILSRVEEKLNSMQLLSSFTADGNAGNGGGDKVSLSSVCGVLRTLHQNFSEEFQIFGLINLLPNLISRVAVIDSWEPFTQYGDLCDMYDSLLPLVEYFESADELQLARQVRKAFADIVELRYLPIVRRAVASAWDPTTEPESCVRLMEALRLVLTTTTFDTTVDMYLVPKLTATVASWRPTLAADAPGIHTWLFPWLPLLTSKLSVLYPEIRRKFGTLLSNMACSDAPGVVAMLLPWVNVFDSSSFENLLVRSALPKLVTFLRGVEINPAQQEIAPVECTLAWCSLTPALPVTHLVCLWVGEFFPKWLRVLYAWLRADGTDFGEVSMWYTGWKGLFPESLLAEEKVTECFALALEMMQTSLGAEGEEGETAMLAFDAVLRRMENDDYYSLIEQHKTLQRAQKRLDILQAEESSSHYLAGAGKTGMPGMTGMAAPASYKQVTFKEVVETYAMRNNVEFVPKMGRLYEGKQLWQFGKSLCFLDQNVVFVSTAEKGGKRSAPGGGGAGADGADGGASRQELYGWAPIALEDLLQLSK
jgi:tuftelin-interacting protein 11